MTGLRRDPLGSAAVHAGPGPSSYTMHVRQVPLTERRYRGAARALAGFRVGAGLGAPIVTSLTRGGVAAQAPWAPTGRTNPAEVPGGPGGRAFARRVRAAVVAILLYNGVAPWVPPGRLASSPARAPSVNKLYSPGGRVTLIRVSGSKFEPGPVTSDVGARREALDLVRQRRPTDGTSQALSLLGRWQARLSIISPRRNRAREPSLRPDGSCGLIRRDHLRFRPR